MEIFTLTQAQALASQAVSYVTSNAAEVFILIGAIVGMSVAAALIDIAAEGRSLAQAAKRWER